MPRLGILAIARPIARMPNRGIFHWQGRNSHQETYQLSSGEALCTAPGDNKIPTRRFRVVQGFVAFIGLRGPTQFCGSPLRRHLQTDPHTYLHMPSSPALQEVRCDGSGHAE